MSNTIELYFSPSHVNFFLKLICTLLFSVINFSYAQPYDPFQSPTTGLGDTPISNLESISSNFGELDDLLRAVQNKQDFTSVQISLTNLKSRYPDLADQIETAQQLIFDQAVAATKTLFPENTFDFFSNQDIAQLFILDDILIRFLGGNSVNQPDFEKLHIDKAREINGIYTPSSVSKGTSYLTDLADLKNLEDGEAMYISEISNPRSASPGKFSFHTGGKAEKLGLGLNSTWHSSPQVSEDRYILVGGIKFNQAHPALPRLKAARLGHFLFDKDTAEAFSTRLFNKNSSNYIDSEPMLAIEHIQLKNAFTNSDSQDSLRQRYNKGADQIEENPVDHIESEFCSSF